MVEKENVILRINPNNFIAREKENQHDDQNEIYSQIINTICSQYKRISKSVLIV
jgi:hypothetical protein